MILDLNSLHQGQVLRSDVCVIGGAPAGLLDVPAMPDELQAAVSAARALVRRIRIARMEDGDRMERVEQASRRPYLRRLHEPSFHSCAKRWPRTCAGSTDTSNWMNAWPPRTCSLPSALAISS